MKVSMKLVQTMLLTLTLCVASPSITSAEGKGSLNLINRIEGIVWDPDRRPVAEIYVELENENYSTISRTRTDSTGRFSFIGVSGGHYNIKVLTTGTNYLEHSEGFDVVNVVQGSSASVYLDIYLKIDRHKLDTGMSLITEAVFVQDVPEEARKLYKKGVKDLNDKGDKGLNEIEEALKIFPTYFDALNTMGREYVARKDYQKALAYLIKSIDINQRSFSSFYALAYACYQLNHRPEALEAARGATIIQANSVNAQLLYGTLLRLEANYEKAESTLLVARKLAKESVPEIYWQLALLYNRLGRNKEAADELEVYLKLQPEARDKKEIQEMIGKLRKQQTKLKSGD